jgi:hypothetical protein
MERATAMAMYACPLGGTYSTESVDYFRKAAGPDLTWDGTLKGGHEQSSKFKQLIRLDLAESQGFVCPCCGNPFTMEDLLTLRVEANHGVAQGKVKRGWFPGNVWVGHKDCNAKTAPIYDGEGNLIGGKPVLEPSDLARPDLVPMVWTPLPVLKRRAGLLK